MLLSELINKCGFDVVTANELNKEIKDGYVGDLLSDVMGNAPAESIWLTVQSHVNILARLKKLRKMALHFSQPKRALLRPACPCLKLV